MNLYQRFHQSVEKFGSRPCVFVKKKSYNYSEVNDLALKIAAAVSQNTTAKEQYIGLFCHRSMEAYAGILGILATGKTYVPLNPKFPLERNESICNILHIKVLIVDQHCCSNLENLIKVYQNLETVILVNCQLPHLQDTTCNVITTDNYDPLSSTPWQNIRPELAYVLFTSGSTGIPKGVPISHINVNTYLENILQLTDINEFDRVSQTFDLTFDLSVHDIFTAFSKGACLFPLPDQFLMAPSRFISQHKLTVWFSVPSVVSSASRLKLLKPDIFPDLRYSLFCGEPFRVDQFKAWKQSAPNSTILNVYGPTEATIAISYYHCEEADLKNRNDIVSIGKIFSDQNYFIASANGTDQKASQGELLLGGKQITSGYLNNEAKNRQAFTEIGGIRYYRTGDLVEQDKSGDLFYVGRKDFQVKINGFRVELEEINSLIKDTFQLPLVQSVAVEKEVPGLKEIVVFIEGPSLDISSKIIKICKQKLPPYMVPRAVRFIAEFPRNFNGKIDTKALTKL